MSIDKRSNAGANPEAAMVAGGEGHSIFGDTVTVLLEGESITIVVDDAVAATDIDGDVELSAGELWPEPLFVESLEEESRSWLTPRAQIASGGMSRILLAFDHKQRRVVAMKILDAATLHDRSDRARFIEEARITGQLDHPNIPPVHDLWLDDQGQLCFTMKLVRGQTLDELLQTKGLDARTDQDMETLLQIFLKVCDAVSFAHSRGVVHRDLKPSNIMVGSHGQVYVMDWGCAMVLPDFEHTDGEPLSLGRDPVTSYRDPPGMAIGTPCFMAPEQLSLSPDLIDQRTDVYLLGGILYRILTDKPPHCGRGLIDTLRQARSGEVKDPQEAAGDAPLPAELVRIAMRALSVDPGDRYESVAALKSDLELSQHRGLWFTQVSFDSGELIVGEGDEADAAYIITEGCCEAFRTENQQRISLRRMGPGEAFGETAIFTACPRTASVEAIEATTAIVVTRETMERAIGGSWLAPFIRALAERFHELDDKLRLIQ